jgi:hypothetical protein
MRRTGEAPIYLHTSVSASGRCRVSRPLRRGLERGLWVLAAVVALAAAAVQGRHAQEGPQRACGREK